MKNESKEDNISGRALARHLRFPDKPRGEIEPFVFLSEIHETVNFMESGCLFENGRFILTDALISCKFFIIIRGGLQLGGRNDNGEIIRYPSVSWVILLLPSGV